jgi:phage gpG-like protein
MSGVVFKDEKVRKLLSQLQKNVKKIGQRDKQYVGLLSSIVFRDIINHFERQEGPNGKWSPWSQVYARFMARVGKSGNLILSDTGRLRQGWQPTRYRVSSEGILWFNPVKYASIHNEGKGRYPQREFAWLSQNAMRAIEKQTAQFLERKK